MHILPLFLTAIFPLAEAEVAVPTPTAESWFPTSWLLMIPVLLLWVMLFPDRNKKKIDPKPAELNKNDRVVTTGGIHGVVVVVSANSEDVVIRVDEHTGTRLRVKRSAIEQVLPGEDETEKSS